jgi:iron complex transport system permease protein
LLALLSAVALTTLVGSEPLPAGQTLCALFSGGKANCGLSANQWAILFEIRLPRILLSAAVGASLASAGAGYQALLRNPLAEPYLLGISNGAAVGTMLALVFFGSVEWSRPVMAFGGALLASLAVYQLARGRTGATPEKMIGWGNRHHVSSGNCFHYYLDGCDSHSVFTSGCWVISRARPADCCWLGWLSRSAALRC